MSLQADYDKTNGVNWLDKNNWNSTKLVSKRFGVIVENIARIDHITEVNFDNLVRIVPSKMDNLFEIHRIVLWEY